MNGEKMKRFEDLVRRAEERFVGDAGFSSLLDEPTDTERIVALRDGVGGANVEGKPLAPNEVVEQPTGAGTP